MRLLLVDICCCMGLVTPFTYSISLLEVLLMLPDNLILPMTSNFSDGKVLPIPTLPPSLIVITFTVASKN